MSKYSMHLMVCGGTGCHSSESDAIVVNLRDELEANGLQDTVTGHSHRVFRIL